MLNDDDPEELELEVTRGEAGIAADDEKFKVFRNRCAAVVVASVLIAVILVAVLTPSTKARFVADLEANGIVVSNAEAAVATAELVCDDVSSGNVAQALAVIEVRSPSLSIQQNAAFFNAAKKFYC